MTSGIGSERDRMKRQRAAKNNAGPAKTVSMQSRERENRVKRENHRYDSGEKDL